MKPAFVMRFDTESHTYGRVHEHAKTCEHCRPLARGTQDVVQVLHRFGCLAGFMVAQEFIEEYERLHSPEERAAHDAFAEKHGVDYIAKAIRGAKLKGAADA